MTNVKTLNRWAMLSCPHWNRGKTTLFGLQLTEPFHKISRSIYRKLYRNAARRYWESLEGRMMTKEYKSGAYYLDTYPAPYSVANFGNWEEDDSYEGYSLLSDQSGFILKHCTSYCAWKIFEETGKWPRRKSRGTTFHAKYWQHFLAEAGYETIITIPRYGHHYVGIKMHDFGEFGEVVWYENPRNLLCESPIEEVTVSTYRNKEHFVGTIDPQHYLWVQIS